MGWGTYADNAGRAGRGRAAASVHRRIPQEDGRAPAAGPAGVAGFARLASPRPPDRAARTRAARGRARLPPTARGIGGPATRAVSPASPARAARGPARAFRAPRRRGAERRRYALAAGRRGSRDDQRAARVSALVPAARAGARRSAHRAWYGFRVRRGAGCVHRRLRGSGRHVRDRSGRSPSGPGGRSPSFRI